MLTTVRCVALAFGLLWLNLIVMAESPIDAILAEQYREQEIKPAGLVNDHLFVRRVSLDLLGRVPTAEELRAFVSDPQPSELIARCLESEEFPQYWSEIWSSMLIGRRASPRVNREALRSWLEDSFRENRPLDQLAFNLISSRGVTALDGAVNFLTGNSEDPATAVSRVFLGVQLDCARCHDHPYDRWTQQDYHDFKQFFGSWRVREVSGGYEVSDESGRAINASELPRFLTGARPQTMAWRRELALMTVRSKPFARAMGNRIWQQLIGRGIVEPADGLSQSNLPSNLKLHDALGQWLRDHRFDLHGLIRKIILSDAYRRASTTEDIDADHLDHAVKIFAVRQPRPLTPEQLLRSYSVISGEKLSSMQARNRNAVLLLGNAEATSGVSDPFRSTRTSQGILYELAMETEYSDKLHSMSSLETLFLSTLSRLPNQAEVQRLSKVSKSDLLFALTHSNEFVFCQ